MSEPKLPEDMDLAYKAAVAFMQRHPDLKQGDELYERSIHARAVMCYHERLHETVRDNAQLVYALQQSEADNKHIEAQLHSAEQRIAVLTKKLQTIADSKRDEYLSFIAKDALGLPHKHDFKCHDPGDYGDGCLHDEEGRLQHTCRYCGITRAALSHGEQP